MANVPPEVWLTDLMQSMGRETLMPSLEEVPGSVWVDDDRVPTPGYYERKLLPLKHRMLRDGRTFAFEFTRRSITYRIRSSTGKSLSENADYVADVVRTLLRWVDDGLTTWENAFAIFIDQADEWWRVLRAPPDATLDEIEAAYKQRAFETHPDRGGTREAFDRIRAAYEAGRAIRGASPTQSHPVSR